MEDKSEELSEFPADVVVPFQVQERVKELKKADALNWPRIVRDSKSITTCKFADEYRHIEPFKKSNKHHTVQGR